MTAKSALMLRVLINRFHQGSPEILLSSLPQENAKEVLGIDVASQDAAQAIHSPKEIVKEVHYSWFGPIIQACSPSMQPLMMSALPSSSAEQLSRFFQIPKHSTTLSPTVRLYLINQLYHKLKPADILPAGYLPQTSLSVLLSFRKEDLIKLIDFLGLYDLADEIRHIVDKKLLNAIYSGLSVKKQHFLRICLHQKGKLSMPRLDLEKWQGDNKQLDKMLHNRGLIRLGKALSGQSNDFIWHIVHRLDTGRGNLLMRYYSSEEIQGVTQVLIQEVLNLTSFFKRMGES